MLLGHGLSLPVVHTAQHHGQLSTLLVQCIPRNDFMIQKHNIIGKYVQAEKVQRASEPSSSVVVTRPSRVHAAALCESFQS
jgi:hypothetical protein